MGYPVFLKVLSYGKRKSWHKSTLFPMVTLIIAAYNEEKTIREKLENTLDLDYPKEKLQIIVASDASTDKTIDIVKEYACHGITLNQQKERKGKSMALNDTVLRVSKGEILVFSDATTLLEKDSIIKLVRNFADQKVGAVCTKVVYVNVNESSVTECEGIFRRYELMLRKLESQIGILPFVAGAFYGLRRELYTMVMAGLPDDSVSPLGVLKKGYLVVFEDEALAYETMVSTPEGELKVKSRGVIRELASIFYFKELLNPFRHPLIFMVLLSHRLLRWSLSICLIGTLIAALFLCSELFYKIVLGLYFLFFLLAIIGYLMRNYRLPRFLFLPFYYLLINFAALWGIFQFFLGRQKPTWEPVRKL